MPRLRARIFATGIAMRARSIVRTACLLLAVAVLAVGSEAKRPRDDGRDKEAGFRRVTAADCSFEQDPDRYLVAFRRHVEGLSTRTERVTRAMGQQGPQATNFSPDVPSRGYIDDYIFGKMIEDGIPHAPLASDAEFLRRVTLDLTGRIPTVAAVRSFLADENPKKRTDLVARLINSSEFVDKWTMFYGDLLRNNDQPTTTPNIYDEGRNALYKTIKDFVESSMPYDLFVQKLITSNGSSWEYGGATYVYAMTTNMGPVQDSYDTFAVRTATQFLGLSNMDCLLCHDGKGHLEKLNAWAATTTRKEAWEISSFFSRYRSTRSANVSTTGGTVYYWTISESTAGDYQLSTTSGNRTNRTAINGSNVIRPRYIFSTTPITTGNYREMFAANLMHDRQFARASVNYLWKEMMGMGIVEPADQFDLKRLNASVLAPGWTVQPSHPELLEALTDDFIASGFNIRHVLETIANSSAYQLSSRFPGDWKIDYATYFARKFTRRLWAEEVHDAVTVASNVPVASPGYTIGGTLLTLDPVLYAMQLPDVIREPAADRDGATAFMNYFLRGNRDTIPRSDEATVLQALAMMNNNFVLRRTKNSTAGSTVATLLATKSMTDDQLIEELFLGTLGRYPSSGELTSSRAALKANRTTGAENLHWALFNKVDFLYNH
jgi:hypothetical protein